MVVNRRKALKLMGYVGAGAILAPIVHPLKIFGGGETETGPINPKGVIEYFEGEVLLDGNEVELGQEVSLGSTIQTGPDSYCELVFGRKNIFQVQENTLAVLNIDETHGSINLETGAVAAVFKRLRTLDPESNEFLISTQTAMAGVRGTSLYVRVEDADNTYICICNGKLALADNDNGSKMSVSAQAHKANRFTRKNGVISVAPARLAYHNSNSMDALARKIKTSINWEDGGTY